MRLKNSALYLTVWALTIKVIFLIKFAENFSLKYFLFTIVTPLLASFWIYWKEKEILKTEKKWLADKIIFEIAGFLVLIILIFSVYAYNQSKQVNPFLNKLAKQVDYNVYGLKDNNIFHWEIIDFKEKLIIGSLKRKTEYIGNLIILKEGPKQAFDKELEESILKEPEGNEEKILVNKNNIKGLYTKKGFSIRGHFVWKVDEKTDIYIRGSISNASKDLTWDDLLESLRSNMVLIK